MITLPYSVIALALVFAFGVGFVLSCFWVNDGGSQC